VVFSVSGPSTNIGRSAEDGRPRAEQAEGHRKENDMLFMVPPPIRAVLGVVLLVIGLLLHMVLLDVAGAAAIAISAYMWLNHRGGPAR
jgi:hypothetical protein